ncbi:ComEC/Rec2 family competence protein [Marinomonas flavescens]|uniref:ComEC/Rec2 family competence protein n=1 Tax=Marinomonas flavescens TaxID=2529379 RepID=UPI001055F838|nr:ComEC/Rec2 family competence protein [Marinomonas flavescens]
MLLSVLILIGAILVPTEYMWLYSTHIILVCLYLICTHRFLMLLLTFVSLIVVYLSEVDNVIDISFDKNLPMRFSPELNQLYVSDVAALEKIDERFFLVRLSHIEGGKQNFNNVQIKPLSQASSSSIEVTLKRFVLASKDGSWLEQRLYAQRQAAQLDIQSDSKFQNPLVREHSIRSYIHARLEGVLSFYSSWRFSKALLLGDDSGWDDRDKWIVRSLGLAHLFVVSGLHTGFVFVFGRLLSRFLWRFSPNKWVLSGVNCWSVDAIIIIPILFFYAYLTDWGAPVVRAAIMLSLYLLSKVLFTQTSPYKVILFALWGILMFDPRGVLQPGLWLSFSLVCFLIAFSQPARRWSRFLLLQLMLSTASMVLIWGWQLSISILSIPVNLLMIPLAAFLWFPIGILASVEALLIQTSYLYYVLDSGIVLVVSLLEYLAFTLPMLAFDTYLNSTTKVMLLCMVVFWVWQAPLKRGIGCVLLIWCVLLLPRDDVSGYQSRIVNNGNELVFERDYDIENSSNWSKHDLSKRLITPLNDANKRDYPVILLARNLEELSPSNLLKNNIDWVLLKSKPSESLQSMLKGLNIHWLSIESGESLLFRQYNNRVSIRHLACSFSIFLFKSDACKRVETLEFMLN